MKRRALLAGIPLAIVAIVVAAWLLDTRAHDGEALRGVEVGGRDVSGLDRAKLEQAVGEVASSYETSTVVVTTPEDELELEAADIGLTVDVDATVDRVLDEGRGGFLPARPLRWVQSLLTARESGVVADLDRTRVRAAVAGENEPLEPGITGDGGELALVLGEGGEGIDAAALADAIVDAAASGELPIRVDTEPTDLDPRFTETDARALLAEAERLTSEPVPVVVGDLRTEIPASTARSWIRSEPGEEALELALDDVEVLDDLAELFASVATEPQDARFSVEGGRPVILRGTEGQACCAPEAVGFLLGAIKAGATEAVRLPLTTVEPADTTAELERLGIVEEIGSFTTRHACCESRVTNIHRIADLVRGVVIDPGARFSVNEHVGRRTTENGFVEGGVIQNGVFETSVGGGISQFATTLFNASFFGGLDFVEYQSHSIYISRYPYGREATLSFPKPDLIIENSTPHGVLIWPTYDSTSITVTLYSTRYARGEQTAQSETPVGEAGCKRVSTTRTRTYVDGRTAEDKVHAVYRPAEGVRCDGPAPTTTTTTAPPPPPASTTTTQAGG